QAKVRTPTEQLKASIDTFGALDYRIQIGDKTRSRLREKFEQGQVAAAKLYGYDNVRHGPVGKGGYSTRAINAEQAEVVRRIFTLYTKELKGAKVIASTLNREGVPFRMARERGKKDGPQVPQAWQEAGITYILRNEAYTGRSRLQSQRPESQE